MTANLKYARRRGPLPLPTDQVRTHRVVSYLNSGELLRLDEARGKLQRGEWLRCAAMDQMPPSVPAVNRLQWEELARVGSNLNQIAHRLNMRQSLQLTEVQAALDELRAALLGVRL